MNLLKRRIAAFCVVGLALGSGLLGCTVQLPEISFAQRDSVKTQDKASSASNTANSSDDTSPAPASSTPTTDNAPASVASDALPAEYTLDQTCEKGTGQTGLDIYFKLPTSDSLRFACVHRVDRSPYLNYGDSTFAEKLADVGGPYCAFSSVSDNVGCALSPITQADLMNIPRSQEEDLQEEKQEQTAPIQQRVQTKEPKQSKQSIQSKQPVQRERPIQREQPAQSEQPKQSNQPLQSEQSTSDQQSPPTKSGTDGLSNDNYYTNSKGNEVHSPAYSNDGSVPEGATAKCKDGTYSFSESRRGTCSSHGGVSQWL